MLTIIPPISNTSSTSVVSKSEGFQSPGSIVVGTSAFDAVLNIAKNKIRMIAIIVNFF